MRLTASNFCPAGAGGKRSKLLQHCTARSQCIWCRLQAMGAAAYRQIPRQLAHTCFSAAGKAAASACAFTVNPISTALRTTTKAGCRCLFCTTQQQVSSVCRHAESTPRKLLPSTNPQRLHTRCTVWCTGPCLAQHGKMRHDSGDMKKWQQAPSSAVPFSKPVPPTSRQLSPKVSPACRVATSLSRLLPGAECTATAACAA